MGGVGGGGMGGGRSGGGPMRGPQGNSQGRDSGAPYNRPQGRNRQYQESKIIGVTELSSIPNIWEVKEQFHDVSKIICAAKNIRRHWHLFVILTFNLCLFILLQNFRFASFIVKPRLARQWLLGFSNQAHRKPRIQRREGNISEFILLQRCPKISFLDFMAQFKKNLAQEFYLD